MKVAVILSVVLALLLSPAAFAQGFGETIGNKPVLGDQAYYTGVYQLITEPPQWTTSGDGKKWNMAISGVRGGAGSGKPLGMYLIDPHVEYRSGYKDLDAKTQAQWITAFHSWMLNHGGGYENFQKYQSEGNKPDPLVALTPEQSNQSDAWGRSEIPYAKQAEFAKQYWQSYDQNFRKTGFVWKDWWVNDSILDANLVINKHVQRYQGGGADAVMYGDGQMARLIKKQ